jgi:hypothetical protein
VTAATTVTTVGAAKFFVFFMPKRDAARPAISCRNVDISFVYKFHDAILIDAFIFSAPVAWLGRKQKARKNPLEAGFSQAF